MCAWQAGEALVKTDPLAMLTVIDLDISAVTLVQAADAIVNYCAGPERRDALRPLYVTSVNGHALSLCARDDALRRLFSAADAIHCDGQALVFLSHLIGARPLPERVATTDLFPLVAARAGPAGLSFYFLGGTCDTNRRLCDVVRTTYPSVTIAGASHGYLSAEEETRVVAQIAALKPDVLWVGMGVPLEQRFALRNLGALQGVGVIKTAGGLFDFISGRIRRAPVWMQDAGLEWLFRLAQEPRRLFWRYAISNPHALFLIIHGLRQSGGAALTASDRRLP